MKIDWSQPPACWSWEVPPATAEALCPVGPAAAERFIQFHQDRCAVCGRSLPLVVDHDHWSGLIRGLVCYGCNGAEGREWTTDVMAFAGYRRRHPAVILEYHEPYRPVGTCVAIADVRNRSERKWRLALQRMDGSIRWLVRKWPTAPEPHATRWVKGTKRVAGVWSAVVAADPLSADVRDRLETLRDLLTIIADVALAIDPGCTQLSCATRLQGEITKLLDPARR